MFLRWRFGGFGTTTSSFAHLRVGELERSSQNPVTTGRFKGPILSSIRRGLSQFLLDVGERSPNHFRLVCVGSVLKTDPLLLHERDQCGWLEPFDRTACFWVGKVSVFWI